MIAVLIGRVHSLDAASLVMNVNGVGYLLSCSSSTIAQAGEHLGSEVTLYVETRVREDAIQLFGFATEDERIWFRILTGVQGVGGRIALNLLGSLGVEGLVSAIASGDVEALKRADGVGPRLAARVASELAGKIAEKDRKLTQGGGVAVQSMESFASAKAALSKLGFKQDEITKALRQVANDGAGEALGVEVLVRRALLALNKVA